MEFSAATQARRDAFDLAFDQRGSRFEPGLLDAGDLRTACGLYGLHRRNRRWRRCGHGRTAARRRFVDSFAARPARGGDGFAWWRGRCRRYRRRCRNVRDVGCCWHASCRPIGAGAAEFTGAGTVAEDVAFGVARVDCGAVDGAIAGANVEVSGRITVSMRSSGCAEPDARGSKIPGRRRSSIGICRAVVGPWVRSTRLPRKPRPTVS